MGGYSRTYLGRCNHLDGGPKSSKGKHRKNEINVLVFECFGLGDWSSPFLFSRYAWSFTSVVIHF